jgi:hypothetical protein
MRKAQLIMSLGVIGGDFQDIFIFNNGFIIFILGKIFFSPPPVALLFGLLATAGQG